MKNIFIKTGLLSMAFVLLLSCDKFLEEDLRDQIATDNFFNNDQEALLDYIGYCTEVAYIKRVDWMTIMLVVQTR